jgi:hypothetical protein
MTEAAEVTQVNEEAPSYKMMNGTFSGSSYLWIGRIGNVAIGVRPTSIANGRAVGGNSEATWFGFKLRAAFGGSLFETTESNPIVPFKDLKTFDKPGDALPIEWDRSDNTRASKDFGILLQGNQHNSIEVLVASMKENQIPQLVTEYLAGLIGHENLVVPSRAITTWLSETYDQTIEALFARAEKLRKLREAMDKTAGQVISMKDIEKLVQDAPESDISFE